MFYSHDLLLQPDSVFFVIWQYATHRGSKVDRRKILSQDVSRVCKSIEMMIPEKSKSPNGQCSLYLLAQLTYGVTLLYSKQIDFLQKDGEKLKEMIRKSNLIMRKMKELERDEKRKRSKQILNVEEEDEEHLDDLFRIGAEIGINANINDITLPENISPWKPIDQGLDELLYVPMELDVNFNSSMYTTFVEGRSSEISRENVAQDADIIQEPNQKRAKKAAEPMAEPVVIENINDKETEKNFEREENSVADIVPQQTIVFDEPTPQPIPDDLIMPQIPLFDDTAFSFPPEQPPQIAEQPQNTILNEEKDQSQEEPEEPPTKKRKEEQKQEEPKEVHREQNPSRPVTPRFDQSVLQKDITDRADETPAIPIQEQTFELDSQLNPPEEIEAVRGTRKKRIQPVDIQLDLEDMRLMRDSYSNLIHSSDQLKIPIQDKNYLGLNELFDPSPYFILRKRFPADLRSLYKSCQYRDIGTFVRDEDEESSIWSEQEDEEEEKLCFAKTFLLPSPEHRTMELNEETILQQNNNTNQFEFPPMIEEPVPPLNPLELDNIPEIPIERRSRKSSAAIEEARHKKRSNSIYDSNPIKSSLDLIEQPAEYRDPFFISGYIIDERVQAEDLLSEELESSYPDWLDFDQFTDSKSRKQAATAFMAVLCGLKNQSMIVKQQNPFDTIYIKKVVEEMSTLSIEQSVTSPTDCSILHCFSVLFFEIFPIFAFFKPENTQIFE